MGHTVPAALEIPFARSLRVPEWQLMLLMLSLSQLDN